MSDRTPGLPTSREADLLRQIEDLIRKVATGDASQNELQRLQELQRTRVGLMRPKLPESDHMSSLAAFKIAG